MLMPLLTPAAGLIQFQLPEGAILASGDLIARLELDDPAAVLPAVPYTGNFPELGPPLVHSQGIDHRFKEAYAAAKMIMAGALPVFNQHYCAGHDQHISATSQCKLCFMIDRCTDDATDCVVHSNQFLSKEHTYLEQ